MTKPGKLLPSCRRPRTLALKSSGAEPRSRRCAKVFEGPLHRFPVVSLVPPLPLRRRIDQRIERNQRACGRELRRGVVLGVEHVPITFHRAVVEGKPTALFVDHTLAQRLDCIKPTATRCVDEAMNPPLDAPAVDCGFGDDDGFEKFVHGRYTRLADQAQNGRIDRVSH
jgi:hypothetical protein